MNPKQTSSSSNNNNNNNNNNNRDIHHNNTITKRSLNLLVMTIVFGIGASLSLTLTHLVHLSHVTLSNHHIQHIRTGKMSPTQQQQQQQPSRNYVDNKEAQAKRANAKDSTLQRVDQLQSFAFLDHQREVTATMSKADVCGNDLLTLQIPYVCILTNIVAVATISEDFSWTPTQLQGDWQYVYAILIHKPINPSPLHSEISFLKKIEYLSLESAVFGSIPTELWSLGTLRYLSLRDSQLFGTIPEYFALHSVKKILLANLQLTGSLPEVLFSISALQSIDFTGNQFSGSLSSEIGSMAQLTNFVINQNNFYGTLPIRFGKLTALQNLQLNFNAFSGSIPSQIGLLTQLTVLRLADNFLSGSLPTQCGLLTNLVVFDVSNNSLSGTLPTQLGLLSALTFLKITLNHLQGHVPLDVSALTVFLDCDYSGVVSDGCSRHCTHCSISEFEAISCDSRGHNQKCVPGYLFLPLLILYFIFVAFILRRIAPPNTSRARLIREASMASLAIADVATDIAFALTVPNHAVFITSLSLSIGFIGLNLVVSMAVISRALANTAFSMTTLTTPQARQERPRGVEIAVIKHHNSKNSQEQQASLATPTAQIPLFYFVLYLTFCALNVRVLPLVVSEHDDDETDKKNIVEKKNNNSKFFRLMEHLTKTHLKLRDWVGLLVLVLEDVPQIVLQIVVLATTQWRLIVILAVITSLLSILVECSPKSITKGAASRIARQESVMDSTQIDSLRVSHALWNDSLESPRPKECSHRLEDY